MGCCIPNVDQVTLKFDVQLLTLEPQSSPNTFIIKEVTKNFHNVTIDASDVLSVEYAKKVGATVLVRGLRATMDFEYELQLAFSNQYLDDSVDMVFLMTRPTHSFISSS